MQQISRGFSPTQRARTVVALLLGIPILLIGLLLTHSISDASAGELHVAAGTPASEMIADGSAPGAECSPVCGSSETMLELLCAALLALATLLPLARRQPDLLADDGPRQAPQGIRLAHSGVSSVSLLFLSISRT